MKTGPAFFSVAVSPVTWSAGDKSTDITLSGANLVATRKTGSSGYRAVRATAGIDASLNGYFEIAITAMEAGGFIILGIGTSSAGLTNYVGADAYGWGYYGAGGGKKFNGGTGTAYGSNFAQGDVIGVAVGNGKVWFGKNNTWNGDPAAGTGAAFSGITGTVFPMASLYDATAPVDAVTGRFKTTAFSYSPPSGFSPWGP